MATPIKDAGATGRALIGTWGSLHAIRTMLSAHATLVFLPPELATLNLGSKHKDALNEPA